MSNRDFLLNINDLNDPNDVIIKIIEYQRPGDVRDWWNENAATHRPEWAGPLTGFEQLYVEKHTSSATPKELQMRMPVDPLNLTPQEREEATNFFGSSPNAVGQYVNYETRRRIIAHYVYTHPATIRLLLAYYRFVRDTNPLHFAFERGFQIGSGREMFTNEEVSRLGASAEFFLFLAITYGVSKVLELSKANPSGAPLKNAPYDAPRWDPKRAGHIFDKAKINKGHVWPETAQEAWDYIVDFRTVASDAANLRTDAVQARLLPAEASARGVKAYTSVKPSGEQIWVFVRNNKIVDAGVNPPGTHR